MKAIELLKLSDSEIKNYVKQNDGNIPLTHFYYTFWDNPTKIWKFNSPIKSRILKRLPVIDFLDNNDLSEPGAVIMEFRVKGIKKLRLKLYDKKVVELERYDRS